MVTVVKKEGYSHNNSTTFVKYTSYCFWFGENRQEIIFIFCFQKFKSEYIINDLSVQFVLLCAFIPNKISTEFYLSTSS